MNMRAYNDQTYSQQPDQSSIGWKITCWVVLLLGAAGAIVYFHRPPDWVGFAIGGVVISQTDVMWALGAAALLALLALFWIINQQTRRRSDARLRRARQAEYALARLLEEIKNACGDMSDDDDDGKTSKLPPTASSTEDSDAHPAMHPMAEWQAGNHAYTDQISHAAQGIARLVDALGSVNQSALQATERARHSTETASQGAALVQNVMAAMNAIRSRIQDAADQLKRLAQSTRQFDASVHLVEDLTAQVGMLSLNASIRGGTCEAAEEMQQLADRSARAAGIAAELVRIIQSDADGVTKALETTADKAAASTVAGDELVRVLAEIIKLSSELPEAMERTANAAAAEVAHARTVGEQIEQIKLAAEQSGAQASQVASGIEKLQSVAASVAQSIPAIKRPPED